MLLIVVPPSTRWLAKQGQRRVLCKANQEVQGAPPLNQPPNPDPEDPPLGKSQERRQKGGQEGVSAVSQLVHGPGDPVGWTGGRPDRAVEG